jgi:hypothetical protein
MPNAKNVIAEKSKSQNIALCVVVNWQTTDSYIALIVYLKTLSMAIIKLYRQQKTDYTVEVTICEQRGWKLKKEEYKIGKYNEDFLREFAKADKEQRE